ncbi:hypothetical protein F8566_11375 [Actinomadura rudentiformis]|uniref:Uncharacterized protein n=1 Tax=Actinomadura rudentiformis TaxID=359158 RepID=A0A6H9Z3Q6_9ACTN|nr:hypothetical protein F8566_11375 [Actinomadura rudentiformis]
MADDKVFRPGEKVERSAIYECDSGCGHRWIGDVKGDPFPSLPEDCKGGGWKLEAGTPMDRGPGASSGAESQPRERVVPGMGSATEGYDSGGTRQGDPLSGVEKPPPAG